MTSPAPESMSPSALALDELLRKARSPEGEREDLEALVGALQRPVEPGQDVRGRAEVLNHIIDDPFIGGMRGSTGQRVDGLAARALVALGEPHVSELSDRAREALGHVPPEDSRSEPEETQETSEEPKPPEQELSWTGIAAIPFFLLAAYEGLVVRLQFHEEMRPLFLVYLLLTLVTPTLVLLLARGALIRGAVGVLTGVLVVVSWPLLFVIYFGGVLEILFEVTISRAALVLTLLIASATSRKSG